MFNESNYNENHTLHFYDFAAITLKFMLINYLAFREKETWLKFKKKKYESYLISNKINYNELSVRCSLGSPHPTLKHLLLIPASL